MKISDIRTHLLSVPFSDPPKTGFLALEYIDLLVVEVETSAGVVGTGHLHPLAGGMRTLEMCIQEMLAPLLIGETVEPTPAGVEAVWDRMWAATFIQGRMGISVMAMSALDIALWDALGRTLGKPLWKLWDGKPDPFPVYGSGCFRGLGHDGMIEKAERFVSQGFDAIKMQVAHLFSADEDVANVRDMRAALGFDVKIMVDANQGWTIDEAISVGRRLDDFALTWLEEPVMADDFDGYHRIATAIETPLAGGENLFATPDFRAFLDSGEVPFLQPDIMRGGYTELRRIGALANAAGLKMAPHLFPELSSHLVATMPNAVWLEYMGWFDDLWIEPLMPVNGYITPPARPGHGMDFHPELLQEYPFRPA